MQSPLDFAPPAHPHPALLQRENLKCLQELHTLHLAQMQQHLDAAQRLKEQVGPGLEALLWLLCMRLRGIVGRMVCRRRGVRFRLKSAMCGLSASRSPALLSLHGPAHLPTCMGVPLSTLPAATDHGVQAGSTDAGLPAVEVKHEQKASEEVMAEVLAAACIGKAS